jgi:hypothetical protein
MSQMSVERRGSPCLDGRPATQLCPMWRRITPCAQNFFSSLPLRPLVPCRLWTVLHLQISLKFYGFPWLVVCDSHGFHKGSKIQHKPSIANLSLNYLESHNGSGKNERTTAAQPRAKRRVFFQDPRSVVRLRTPCPLPTCTVSSSNRASS